MDERGTDSTTRRLRVVIADDSVVIRDRMRRFLSTIESIDLVAEAGDARETIEVVAGQQPDVLILDLFMPGGGGIRVLEHLRGKSERPVVIVQTNFPDPEYVKACRRAGAEHFLDKSDDPGHLADLLQGLAHGR